MLPFDVEYTLGLLLPPTPFVWPTITVELLFDVDGVKHPDKLSTTEFPVIESTTNGSTRPLTESANKNEWRPLSKPFGVNGGGDVPVVGKNDDEDDDEEFEIVDIDVKPFDWLLVLSVPFVIAEFNVWCE